MLNTDYREIEKAIPCREMVYTRPVDEYFDLRYGKLRLWHLANKSAIAWAELARLAASIAGVDASRVEARPTRELCLAAVRPTYSVLGSERGVLLPSLDNAISRYFDERQRF
jgi:dTDP-4-dehydrorhamnose reductase